MYCLPNLTKRLRANGGQKTFDLIFRRRHLSPSVVMLVVEAVMEAERVSRREDFFESGDKLNNCTLKTYD